MSNGLSAEHVRKVKTTAVQGIEVLWGRQRNRAKDRTTAEGLLEQTDEHWTWAPDTTQSQVQANRPLLAPTYHYQESHLETREAEFDWLYDTRLSGTQDCWPARKDRMA